ncbi:prepilin-type N-terminal cleavage/methylation domain-containing protein [Neptuniibacter sp. QD72_48]|uniref:prepilin-type N-terminal cleavage/methylation domain-containing protein n=1 Tax=unclassified Neptuniibacter TaxID=2630693 RepID=UPI0039F49907
MKNVVNKQHGFTLLELVVVVAVMGLIASLATEFVVQETNQQRFETTKTRVSMIRYAVVGDDSRTVNSQPIISGYVTDMGVLPTELRQLMMESYCTDARYFSSTDCGDNGGAWVTQSGWQGPYLKPTSMENITDGEGNSRQIPVFRDAWGNRSADSNEDWKNFGWDFARVNDSWSNDAAGLNLKVQSFGLDGVADTTSPSSSKEFIFEQDYPVLDELSFPLVTGNDYLASGQTVSFELVNNSGSNVDVCVNWTGVDDDHEDYLNMPSGTTNDHDFPTTMGYVNFSVVADSNTSDGVCDNSNPVDAVSVLFASSSIVTVYGAAPLPTIEISVEP